MGVRVPSRSLSSRARQKMTLEAVDGGCGPVVIAAMRAGRVPDLFQVRLELMESVAAKAVFSWQELAQV
jgi:hypothetical protein